MDNSLHKALPFASSLDTPKASCDAVVFSFDRCSHSTRPGKVSFPKRSTHQFSQGLGFPNISSCSPGPPGRMFPDYEGISPLWPNGSHTTHLLKIYKFPGRCLKVEDAPNRCLT